MNVKKKFSIIIISAVTLALLVCGCGTQSSTSVAANPPATLPVSAAPTSDSVSDAAPTEQATEYVEPATEYIEPVTVSLVAVGDMLMHAGASIPAAQPDGSYNYDYLFANVRGTIESADIAVVNNEVIMAGNELGNIGYPCFNVRTELGDAEVNAGFDVVLGATNHTMDQNASGILNCVSYWDASHPDMAVLGIHGSADDASQIYVREVNGVRIAMLNYTYGTNGIEVPAGYEYAIDLMNDSTKPKIADDIARAKSIADFVIVYPHWGTEYNLGISDEQSAWANFFAEQGVDLVIGTHPHVIEPVQWIESSTGHKTLVYYSLGNFVSIQYYNFSMLGGMAKVSITKDADGTRISDYDMDFLVTHYTPGRTAVTTYFLDDYTEEMASSHAILTEPPENYKDVNAAYPFTVEGLRSIVNAVCPEFAE